MQRNKKFQKSEITMEVGGWVQVSLGIFFLENHPKIPPNQYRYFGVVYHMYSVCIYCTLLKVVSYYDSSALSMSVMSFQKKKVWVGGWVCGVSSIQVFFWNFFNFAKTPKVDASMKHVVVALQPM